MEALRVFDAEKWYGPYPGIREVNLSISPNTVCGLLGANGAGKTTLLNMIAAQARPSNGSIMLFGNSVWADPLQAKRRLGFVSDDDDLPDYLTGREYLLLASAIHGMTKHEALQRVEELLVLLDMTSAADRLIKGYSHGMRKKIQISAGLIHKPGLLVIDEPTNGLDPLGIRNLRQMLRAYAGEEHAVLIATHALDFASQLCDKVYIVFNHMVVAEGSPQQLCTRFGSNNMEDVYVKAVTTITKKDERE